MKQLALLLLIVVFGCNEPGYVTRKKILVEKRHEQGKHFLVYNDGSKYLVGPAVCEGYSIGDTVDFVYWED